MIRRSTTLVCCLALIAGLLAVLRASAAEDTPLTAIALTSGVYSQDFDMLASSGSSNVVPDGWKFSEDGTAANTVYSAGTGSSTTGDTYSFGVSGSSERAFGGLRTGSLNPTIGAGFVNDSGAAITGLAVSYVCEQWRVGVANRGAADRMDFQYSTDAISLTVGTWIDVDSLDCLSTYISDSAGAKNGNDEAYRTALSGIIAGLDIAAGQTFWLRWRDFDISGADDGLAIDDLDIEPLHPAAVTLAGFGAHQVDTHVFISWETVSEIGNAGFNLYRADGSNAPQILLAYVPSQAPGSTLGSLYTYWDEEVTAGQTLWYWLHDVSLSGAITAHGPISITIQAPTAVLLAGLQADSVQSSPLGWPAVSALLILALTTALARGRFRLRR